ncbi:MAG: tRNA lysidine(34) synthetase TilS, partial [bacterium]|nr:tRNA lysidine(34) synthetase TilS [bacterium]
MIRLKASLNIKSLERKFLDSIEELNIAKTSKILCAVSGGPDSIFMLYMFAKNYFDVYVAHINHAIRKNSDRDQEFVESFSNRIGVKCYSTKLKIYKFSEAIARALRYKALKKIAYKINVDYIATGHTKDDNFETILFNFFRTGQPRAIPKLRLEDGFRIVRPLLDFEKEEIV